MCVCMCSPLLFFSLLFCVCIIILPFQTAMQICVVVVLFSYDIKKIKKIKIKKACQFRRCLNVGGIYFAINFLPQFEMPHPADNGSSHQANQQQQQYLLIKLVQSHQATFSVYRIYSTGKIVGPWRANRKHRPPVCQSDHVVVDSAGNCWQTGNDNGGNPGAYGSNQISSQTPNGEVIEDRTHTPSIAFRHVVGGCE